MYENGTDWWNELDCNFEPIDRSFTGHLNKNGTPLTSSKGPMEPILQEDYDYTRSGHQY